jgi:hypothetical protein
VTQLIFLAANALGVLLGAVYNANTPDLYPGNAHHSIGWIITWVVSAHVVVSLIGRAAGALKCSSHHMTREKRRLLPLSAEALEHSQTYHLDEGIGQGGLATSESDRSHSGSTAVDEEEGLPMPSPYKEYGNDDDDQEELEEIPLANRVLGRRLGVRFGKVASFCSLKTWKYIEFGYRAVDRIILPFGFVAFTTGIVTYGRLFVSPLASKPGPSRLALYVRMRLTNMVGRPRCIRWSSPLDQRWCVFLARTSHLGALGGQLR